MGLDTTHDCWHGPYSAFSRFREHLARAAGYAVWRVQHDYGTPFPTVMLDWGHLGTEAHLEGEWEETPSDPLLVLIVHRDDGGQIHPAQAGALADRIEELAPLVTGEEAEAVRERAARFVAGLRAALAANQPVRFH